ncbi:MAG: hypothetical protein Q8K00_15065 [Syntrophales bacterium]|nr:hypothetical protein [Syntrophales bacterium]
MATRYLREKLYQRNLATRRSDPGQSRMFMNPGGPAETAASIRCNGVKEVLCTPQTFQGEVADSV